MSDKPSVKLNKICKEFHTSNGKLEVLKEISLDLHNGEIIGVIGRSGCGKTTLLNIISNLDLPTRGDIIIKGDISYVPQQPFLLPWRTILENVLFPLEIQNKIDKKNVKDAKKFLEFVGLGRFLNYFPNQMSGGMNQRASIVKELLRSTEIILFDEPLSALDFETRLLLIKKIREYIKSSKKSAIFVTHNIEEAITIADRIITLSEIPAKIKNEYGILISEPNRHPAKIKKLKQFHEAFEKIWKDLKLK